MTEALHDIAVMKAERARRENNRANLARAEENAGPEDMKLRLYCDAALHFRNGAAAIKGTGKGLHAKLIQAEKYANELFKRVRRPFVRNG